MLTRTLHTTAHVVGFLICAACSDGVGHPLVQAPADEMGGAAGAPSSSATSCDDVARWPEYLETSEEEMAIALRSLRAASPRCGGSGIQGEPLPDLSESGALRCSARLHALDMSERQFFAEVTPDGVGPAERMLAAGFQASAWAEIVAGGGDAVEVIQELFWAGGADCEEIVSPEFDEFGVGRWQDLWTIDFGRR